MTESTLAPSRDLSLPRAGLLLGGLLFAAGTLPVAAGESLVSSWSQASTGNGAIHPSILQGVGLAMFLLATIGAIPRLVRALMMLGGLGGLVAYVAAAGTHFDVYPLTQSFVQDELAQPLFGLAFALAAFGELLSVARPRSKTFAAFALVGWTAVLLTFLLPDDGRIPVIMMFGGFVHVHGPISLASLMLRFFCLGLSALGVSFAIGRLRRAPGAPVAAGWRSGWAGIAIAATLGLHLLLTVIEALGSYSDLLIDALSDVCLVLAYGIGIPLVLAHLVLALVPERQPEAASAETVASGVPGVTPGLAP